MADFFVFYTLKNPNDKLTNALTDLKGVNVLDDGFAYAWVVRTERNAKTLCGNLGNLAKYSVNLFVVEIADAAQWQQGGPRIDDIRKLLDGQIDPANRRIRE